MYPHHEDDARFPTRPEVEPPRAADDGLHTTVMAMWIAHLVGVFTNGLGNVVAVAIAYVKREDAHGTIYADHFAKAIRYFWIAAGIYVVGWVLVFVVVGALVLLGLSIWVLIFSIRGILRTRDRRPYGP
ncbi:Uncharacterized membrane protein [Limimonas halophila]|uniref:Uncharacterized membrane protein n=1 Tax=Limimonas halophila TaxID=1082479 RepID=A0A1G7TEP0_9PROT|nr:DUF4870 domain-containing protein [Limimonas halophila]SDG33030.1 Uncharacterized membrane protein [Limimonas halophila]